MSTLIAAMPEPPVLKVGIDLGTSRSSISAANGERHMVRSYVGWPRDMVARKVLRRDVLVGIEALEKRPMLDLRRPLERGLIKEGSARDEQAVREIVRRLLQLAVPEGGDPKPAIYAVVGVPAETLRVNRRNLRRILDGQVTAPVYFSGKNPAFALLGDLIAAYNHTEEMFLFLRRGRRDALLRYPYSQSGLHPIGCAATAKQALVSTIPLRGVDDLDGIKIRAPEGMAQDIFSVVGAAPVNLPAAEVFTAIERGVVDAADWATFSMNHQLGFHRIAQYPVYPGIHSLPVIDVAVNQERWDALAPDVQAILEAAVWDFSRDITHRLELRDLADVAAARADGVEIIDWPMEERSRLREIATGIWADWSTRSPEAEAAYTAQSALLRELGLLAK